MRRSLCPLVLFGAALLTHCASGGATDEATVGHGGNGGTGQGGTSAGGLGGTSAQGGTGHGGGGAGGANASSTTSTGGAGGAGTGGATTSSTTGTGGATTSSTTGTGGADACQGITCNAPPANVCENNSSLRVYEASGACSAGQCSYASSTQACANGCANGACVGDPCQGVTCNSPGAKKCADGSHLTVFDAPGSCSGGNCTYGSHEEFCQFGCVNDICNGDPCQGVTCSSPPANYCKSASILVVPDAPGACSDGVCSYPSSHDVYCAYGCANGACVNDPCAGKSCDTPPARDCKDASTARIYPVTGSCSGGLCAYPPTEVPCPNGCVGGFCKDCSVDSDCTAGKWCQSGTCAVCNSDAHCGGTCTNCSAASKVCSAGSCVACVVDSQCAAGKYCAASVCASCDTDAKCGASCSACSGLTPTCSGGACVCSGNSCGVNQQCVGNACSVCKSDAACGATCTPCGGAAPHCLDQGASSVCVACRSDADCGGTDVCNPSTHTCGPACPATATSVFGDAFTSPNSSTWSYGVDVAVGATAWKAYTDAKHGVRAYSGQLQITNERSGYADHGHGFAYVKTGGAGSAYNNTLYSPTLKQNTGKEVIWTFNMQRDDPYDDSTDGGFKCSSPSSQNGNTVGLAYVLATSSAAGLVSSTSSCNPTGTATGYAVVLGGSGRLRLVRFTSGLRNGAITDVIASKDFNDVSRYFSARVTYNATNDQWKLEARDDGASKFADPAAGSFGWSGTAIDNTYVNTPLEYASAYFQTGCSGLCDSVFDARFDNVNVAVRCAP